MKKLVFYIIVTTFIGILPSLLQYGAFMPFGDFANQQIPFIMETKRMLASGHPWWSWNTYFGDNFIGAYSFYTLTSPFVWLNCLFPYEYIIESITLTLFLKLICMGLFTFLYLKKMDLDEDLSQVGAMMYVFSSFSITNLYYYHFLEPMMCFPLFLIAIEKYVRGEKYSDVLLSLATFLISFINFYFFPCSLIPGIIYYLCRISSKEHKFSGRKFGYAVFLVLLGTCMSAFILLPSVLHLAGGPRADANLGLSVSSTLVRIRALLSPEIVEGPNHLVICTSWNSNAAYIPIFGCFLAILYCWKKRDWIARLCIIVVVLFITPLNGLFSLFTNPYYSRWAYALVLFLILASMKYLSHGINISVREVVIYSSICLVFFLGVYALGWIVQADSYFSLHKSHFIINAVIVVLFLFSIFLMWTYARRGNRKSLIKYVCLFSVVNLSLFMIKWTEVSFNVTKNPHEMLIYQGINQKYVLNNKLERLQDNHMFNYRTHFISRNSVRYNNISLLKNRPSIETFHSVQNNNIRELFNTSDSTNIARNNRFCPTCNIASFESLMSVRNIIIYNDPKRKFIQLGRKDLEEKGDGYVVYSNLNYLPMGFTYDHYIDEKKIDSLLQIAPLPNVPLQLLANLAVTKESIPVISKYLVQGLINDNFDLDSVVMERRKTVCSSFEGDTHGFSAAIDLPKDNLVFFSVPADKGFFATIDGKETQIHKVNLGQIGIVVPKGKHSIRCEYSPTGLKEGSFCSIIALLIIIGLAFRNAQEFKQKSK